MLAYSVYSKEILVGALFYYNNASKDVREGCIASSRAFRAAIYTTNFSEFLSKATLANSCLSINLTCLVVGKVSVVLYVLQVKFFVSNYISILLRDKKSISRITFLLVLTSKTVFSKNQILSNSL